MPNHLNQPRWPSIPGYSLTEELYVGGCTAVYRALADFEPQACPVVIKVLKSPRPSAKALVRFRNQYIIAKNLPIEGIVRPLTLEPWEHSYALVMADVGGIALSEYLHNCGPLSVTAVLEIALQMADILHGLSQHRVLHKDINPANILIHPDTHKIWLTDFGLASLLPKDSQQLQNPGVLEGTLAYIAPEQTGRMNRGIDYRADFYGLGVTLYELLTGALPFQDNDPMALIHSHIAKLPVTPCEAIKSVDAGEDGAWVIPQVMSDIVLKLMAKNAEERYQSALGLKHDLQTCLSQWTAFGQIEPFEFGQEDRCDRFLIPEKLYGRETDIQTLLASFDRVAQGASELMLVAGFSGIGKTAVVNEVYRAHSWQKGYFIKGKFDQGQRNIPFFAFVQAFRSLMGQLLGASDAALADWKTKILAAVGDSGQVLIEVIPELEQIIGTQPDVPELSGTAAQNRFNFLFGKFSQVFATLEHPLVIFLDDLQWIDSASLSLLTLLMDDAHTSYLLILGAYRNNEVTPTHPLMQSLAELKQTSAAVGTLTLGAIDFDDINQLVAETLSCSKDDACSLARLIHQKTHGNPFFVRQLLQEFYEDGLLTFNTRLGYWECGLEDINQAILSDESEDDVDFITRRLHRLSQESQEVLWLGACLGYQFDLETLSIISQKPQQLILPHLWEALQEGLLLPVDDTYEFLPEDIPGTDIRITPAQYRFLHDRVQQAAYGLIPKSQRTQVHYKIGQLLIQEISTDAEDERIFELMNHLNYGFELISSQVDRDNIADLNLKAAQKARRSTAYQAGFEYASMGISLLGDNAWKSQYEKNLQLHELAAELAFLCGDLGASQQLIETIIREAQSLLDQINIYCLKIQISVAQTQLTEAITTAQEILQRLGISWPQAHSQDDIWQWVLDVEQMIGDREISELSHLPRMTDETNIAIIRIISRSIPAAYISGSPFFPLWVILATKISIQFGNIPASAFIYINYSYILCHYFQAIDAGEAFGQLALQLVDDFDAKAIKPHVFLMFGLYTLHRKSYIQETLPLLRQGYTAALEVGNYEWVGYGAYAFCSNAFACNQNLVDLEQKIRSYCDSVAQLNQMTSKKWCQIYWQAALNLIGHVDNPEILSGQIFQEEAFFSRLNTDQDLLGLFYFHLYKLMLCYLFEANDVARTHAIEAKKYLIVAGGTVGLPMFYFYDALSALTALKRLDADSEKYHELLQQVNESQNYLQQDWANHAPMNYQHKVDLIAAEKYQLTGQVVDAIDHYDQAIAGSRAHKYSQEEALANELAAKFYLAWGKERVAAGYLQEAYYGYARWGAKAKTDDLEKRYPQLLQPVLTQPSPASPPLSSLHSVAPLKLSVHSASSGAKTSKQDINQTLDLTAVLKAARALSESIDLNELLEKLAQMMMQTSGAERLALILPNAGEAWQVRVMATPESIQLTSTMLGSHTDLPIQLIQYVQRTQEVVAVDGLDADLPIVDAYLQQYQPRSALCLPLLHQNQLKGLLYLQHQSVAAVFHRDRITILNFLCTQAAISLENAQLYHTLEQRVAARTQALQASQHELTDYIENAATSLHWVDASGIITWANQTELDLLGYRREEYIGQPIANFHADEAVIGDLLRRLSNRETIVNHEARLRCKDGSIRYVQISSNVFYRDGEFIHTRCFTTDITERKSAEMALNDLVAGTAATIGEDFFPALVRHISVALEVPIALVTQFVDQELQSLAFVVDGEFQPSFTQNLSETPCGELSVEYAHHYPQRLSERFPNHPLQDLELESYLGVALRDRQGQVLGSLCIFDRKPLQAPERAQQILEVFGGRAAAELERQRIEKALQNLVTGTVITTRTDFFPALVGYLTEALGVSYALMAERIDDEEVTLAYFCDGELLPPQSIPIPDTPCEEVYKRGAYYCEFEPGQSTCIELNRVGARSYLGVTLNDSQGNAIGLLAIFHRQVLLDPIHAEQILRVFAARASTELARQRAENALQNLIAGTAALIGPDFFTALVRYIAEALEASHVFVTEVVEGDRLHFLAAWGDGQYLPNDTVEAEGTTCALALRDGVYHCERNVIACFPQNPRLAPMQVESYMGVALKNGQGQAIGTLCIFARQAIVDPEHSAQILRVFAARVTAELERQRAEQAMEQLNRELEIRVCDRTAQLAESEKRFKTLFNEAADAVLLLGEQGVIDCNQAAIELLGYTNKADFLALHPSQVSPEQQPDGQLSSEKFERLNQEALQRGSLRFEWLMRHSNGEDFWTEITLTPVRYVEENVLHCSVRDIRNRKAAEAALAESEIYHRKLCSQSSIGLLLCRMDGAFVYANQAFLDIVGRDKKELPDLSHWEITPEKYAEAESIQLDNLHKNGCYGPYEKEYFHKDGHLVPVRLSGVIVERSGENFIWSSIEDISDRKHYEQQLQDLSERLELAIESAQIGLWVWDSRTDHLSWDERMFEIYGLQPEAFGGTYQDWANCVHPEDLAQAESQQQSYSTQGVKRYTQEFRILWPDRTIRYILATAAIQRDAQGQPIRSVGLNFDITERKTAELALQDAQARFQRMTENVPGMIFRYILHPDGSDEIPYVSSQVREIFEVDPAAVLQDTANLWERVHPGDLTRLGKDIQRSAKTLTPFTSSYRLVLPEKGLRWVQNMTHAERLDNGAVVWDGVVVDISDRIKLEQEQAQLNESLSLKSSAIEASDVGIAILKDDQYIYLNKSHLSMMGYEHHELVGKHWKSLYDPEEFERLHQHIFPVLAQQGRWLGEAIARRKDGSYFPQEVSLCALEGNKMICICRDISDRKQAERQLQRTNQELARATRLKDEFLANMSHELRTPLNAILGMAESLHDEVFGPVNAQQLNALKTVEQSGSHLLELINEILDLAKIESGNIALTYAAVSVTHLCQSSLTFIKQQSLAKGLQLYLKMPWDLPPIRIDERRIRQVLINLLNNAVKFTPSGGDITLKIEPLSPDDDAHRQPYLRLSVIDTGIGIAPQSLKHLFQPFVQIDSALNREYDGTGLGLALVKRIVELHGGRVSVTSNVGVGSCFTIELPYDTETLEPPLAQTTPALLSAEAPTKLGPSAPPPLILLAEDNEANIVTLSSYLQAKGYRIQVATSGLAAIELAQAERPHVILMDIQMPDMDGLTAIEHMRQRPDLKHIPIIALTAFAMEADKTRCLAAGADQYLSKPVKLKQLAASIQALTP